MTLFCWFINYSELSFCFISHHDAYKTEEHFEVIESAPESQRRRHDGPAVGTDTVTIEAAVEQAVQDMVRSTQPCINQSAEEDGEPLLKKIQTQL